MKVKELQKTVNVAWSPQQQYPIYLAAGSAAQQLDSSGSSVLEIYSTNFKEQSYDLELKASLPSQYRFQKIIWSPTGSNGSHPNGLIVGGCEGGHLMIYSAAKMLAGDEGLVARQDTHTGPVRGLDFNPFQTNLLASVASESEIFVWDLNNTATHMTPGTKTQPLEDVQNVAWNRQVQHILASVFSSRCVIWDLRKNEQIIKLSDTQSRVRWRAVQWHPDVATQIWLASEEDQAPVVQMWDLRYATAPAKTMQIHQRGVLGMSWCPKDSDMMVSCGKDNKIYCWNPNTSLAEGEILSEVAVTSQWYSDVQWCPRNPALIASSSLDGNVSIYSLFGGTQQQVQTSNKIADSFPGMDQFAQAPIPPQTTQITYADPSRPPKWVKRPCGVKFGFGGKLVCFNSKSKAVQIRQIVTEPELVERATALEKSLADSNFVEFCRSRADQQSDQDSRYLWYFLKANFELNPKEEMLNLLGYNKDDIDSKFSKYIKDEDVVNAVDQITDRISTLTHSDSSEVECDQSTDESTDISQAGDQNQLFDSVAAGNKILEERNEKKSVPFKIPRGDDSDSLISEAIITGNIEAAVQLCLESDRPAEALIIASTAGIEFLTKTQDRFLKKQSNELSNVISALVTRDWMDLVSRCTVDSWKEALVAALKHSDRKVADICEKLGDRLLAENSNIQYTRNAILCYICAGNIDKLVDAWYQLKQSEKNDSGYELDIAELQELAEVVMLLSKSLEQQGVAIEPEGKFAEFVSVYGEILAAQGALNTAMTYIFALGPSTHPELDDLRNRLYSILNQKDEFAQGSQRYQPQQQPQQQPPQQENFYSKQSLANSQPRGSFSTPGFPPAPVQNTFNTGLPAGNQWNSPIPAAPMPSQPPPPMTMFTPSQPSVPTLNPGLAQPVTSPPVKPPSVAQINDSLVHPPRPSSVSSQGSTTLPSRAKYILDPSVSSGPQYGGQQSYGGGYIPPPAIPPTNFNPMPFAPNQTTYQSPTMMQPLQSTPAVPTIPTMQTNFMQPQHNNYLPGVPPLETAPPSMPGAPPLASVQRNPTPPPGWNDPPVLKSSRQQTFYSEQNEMYAKHAGTRKWQKIINHTSSGGCNANDGNQPKKTEPVTSAITHPLFGVDPNQNQNGYPDPNAQYQNQSMPPPSNMNQQQLPPQMPYNPNQQNNNQFPRQMNFQTSAVQSQYQQQNTGYTEQPAQIQQRQPEPPKEKPPLPEEFIYMQTVFEELKTQCLATASDPRTKRKFADVVKRLENLYDCLRDGRLTPNTITALNQIIQYIQIGDYGNALATHTSIAFGTDFAQTASFMPGIKVLVQSAADLKVYLR